jgi:hypothetical protein
LTNRTSNTTTATLSAHSAPEARRKGVYYLPGSGVKRPSARSNSSLAQRLNSTKHTQYSGGTFGLQELYNGLLAAFTIPSVAWSMMAPRNTSKHILSTVISTPITHSLLAAHPRKRVRGFRVTEHDRTRQLERTCDLLLAEHLTKLVLRATVKGS